MATPSLALSQFTTMPHSPSLPPASNRQTLVTPLPGLPPIYHVHGLPATFPAARKSERQNRRLGSSFKSPWLLATLPLVTVTSAPCQLPPSPASRVLAVGHSPCHPNWPDALTHTAAPPLLSQTQIKVITKITQSFHAHFDFLCSCNLILDSNCGC